MPVLPRLSVPPLLRVNPIMTFATICSIILIVVSWGIVSAVIFATIVPCYASYTSRTGRMLRAISYRLEDFLDCIFSDNLRVMWIVLDYGWRLSLVISLGVTLVTVFPNATAMQWKAIAGVVVVVWYVSSTPITGKQASKAAAGR